MTSDHIGRLSHSSSLASISTTSIDYTSPKTPSLPSQPHSPVISQHPSSSRQDSLRQPRDPRHGSPLIRMASGIVSARVGLGSPKIDFGREWIEGSSRRKGSDEPSEEIVGPEPEPVKRTQSGQRDLVDYVSGLPSPPGTESDIALPNVSKEPSLMSESPPPSLSPSPKYQSLRRTSSTQSRPLNVRTSSNASSTSANGLSPSSSSRIKALRPVRGDAMSRSNSSSSNLVASPLRPKGTPSPGITSSRRLSTDLSRQSSLAGSTSSKASVSRNSGHLRSSTGSVSPTKSSLHRHSPSAPLPRLPSPIKQYDDAWSTTSPQREDPSPRPSHSRRISSGTDLDTRIRDAEEKIRSSGSRRPRPSEVYTAISPKKPDIRRHDSYTRASGSNAVESPLNGGETLRRSATVSGAGIVAKTPTSREHGMRLDNQEHSGGSTGSKQRKPLPTQFRSRAEGGLFTPSPKPTAQGLPRAQEDTTQSPTTHSSRFSTTSRLTREPQTLSSPSSSNNPSRLRGDHLDRNSDPASRRDRRQWSESISGLPRRYQDETSHYDLPSPRKSEFDRHRAESVMDSASLASRRFNQDRDLTSRSSRLNLTPGDSVSAVGARSEKNTPTQSKDPLDVLRRIEARREEHNRSWERSASVLGDNALPTSGSRSRADLSPLRVRPATSMSSLRDRYDAPRTAPVDRVSHRPFDDSPSLHRISSRLSHVHTNSEPRQMRSSTSLGGRSSASLDVRSASSEHGRLLYEACRALELKLPHDTHPAVPDLHRTFGSAARSAETSNAALRTALQLLNQIGIDAELEVDPERIHGELQSLMTLLREATRASDQNVRDLTRVMLDVPKLLREGSRLSYTSNGLTRTDRPDVSRRFHGSVEPYESPVRRSEEMLRPATSMGDVYSNSNRRSRDSLPPNFGLPDRERNGFLNKMRNLAPGRQKEASVPSSLGTIEDSPPSRQTDTAIQPLPISPVRRVLKKKISSTSTHTVRAGNNNFLPTSGMVPTTALSTVTAGEMNMSPTTDKFKDMAISYRSKKSSSDWDEMGPSSPASRFSYHTAEEQRSDVGPERDQDDVLEGLVAAQRRREEQEGRSRGEQQDGEHEVIAGSGSGVGSGGAEVKRKWSVSDRFRATLRRGG